MTGVSLFPFIDYWWFYGAFTLFFLGMLALDLGVFHRRAHEVSGREALSWSVVWTALALGFAALLYGYCLWKFPIDPRLGGNPGAMDGSLAWRATLEFLTGFLIEKSLALDNIFVFVVIFQFFFIPAKYQHRVLFFGILGALLFRVVFIALGAVLLQYKAVVILFGVLLIATGAKILFAPVKPIDPEANLVIRLLRRLLPVTSQVDDQNFFRRVVGKLHATPLLVALAFIEVSDILFAVDSVPAIFAVTSEPLIVFTSNVFAILGMRALYFLLAAVAQKFQLIKYALGAILVFVGLKMAWLNEAFGGKFPISWSLAIIASILIFFFLLSLTGSSRAASAGASAISGDQKMPSYKRLISRFWFPFGR
jgi:tellurite resistance protein TerC